MIVAVASGKGGTGKTMISTAIALSVGACTYLDLDVEEPNGYIFLTPDIREVTGYTLPVPKLDESRCIFCERCSKACQFNAITVIPSYKRVFFSPDLCHSCGACTYVCPVEDALEEVPREIGTIRTGTANDGLIRFTEGRLHVGLPSGVPLIRGIIKRFSTSHNLVIIDASPGTSCPVVESIKTCDFVLLVTEPTPFGLSDLKLTVQLVKELGKEAGIIINKDNGEDNLITAFAREKNIPLLLRIPYSIEIQEAYSMGIPFTQMMSGIPGMKENYSKMIDKIMQRKHLPGVHKK
jgi:MinD superfamily P-loop ATPase